MRLAGDVPDIAAMSAEARSELPEPTAREEGGLKEGALTSGVLLRLPATWLPDILSILRLRQNGVKERVVKKRRGRGAKDGRTVGEFLQYPAEQAV